MATAQKQIHVVSESEESQVCRISRNRIRRFPDQPRKHFEPEKLKNLTQSIRKKGQQIPVTIRPVSDDPEHDFELVGGERRWIACGMAGIDTVLAWIRPISDVEEQFELAVIDNFGSAGHTPLETAWAIDKIQKSKRMQELSQGERIRKIANVFVRSEVWIYQHLALLRLHPDVLALMAPTVPEEERLNFSLGVFISSLHHDLQLEVAKVVLAKKMSLKRARLYAQQVAEKADQEVGTNRGNKSGLPSKSWTRLKTLVRVTQEGIDALLLPTVQTALQKRDMADRKAMVVEIGQCIARLDELKVGLIQSLPTPLISQKTNGRPPIPAPVPKPPPASRLVHPSNLPREQPIELSHRILRMLFYPSGQPHPNLSRRHLQGILSDVENLDVAVSRALREGKNFWRIESRGLEAEAVERLIRLMSRFCREYGNPREFENALRTAEERDSSQDPVSLHFKE